MELNWVGPLDWSLGASQGASSTLPLLMHSQGRGRGWAYLDGEVIPHVFPEPQAAQVGHPAAPPGGSVIVEEPPDGIEHAEQPEAREHQVKEAKDAGGC